MRIYLLLVLNLSIGSLYAQNYLLTSEETPTQVKKRAYELLKSVELDSENPADGEYTAVIGSPYAKWYFIENNYQVVRLEYLGCGDNSGNLSSSFYPTVQDALSDSCDPSEDVSWSWGLYFDANGVLDWERSDRMWDWSGH